MHNTLTLLVIVIIAALIFDYINGFHDAANSIATIVSTKVLRPSTAIMFAAVLNLFGAFLGVEVAKTVGSGLVELSSVTQITVLTGLIGAITWNLITWYFGLPSSSSHALMGGICGSAAAAGGFKVLNGTGLLNKVFLPMVISPIIGLVLGFIVMTILYNLLIKSKPSTVNSVSPKMQMGSAAFMALSHGTNDAQKTMGIMTMALVSYSGITGDTTFHIPTWVIIACALAMGFGTMAGGWKIIHTMGSKMIKLQPIHGFAAETSAAAILFTASHFGMPLSTTHVISTCIMGVGSAKRFSAVRWGIVGNILAAWVLTFPMAFGFAALSFYILNIFFH
jgi:PiT family inorganic phosphate transporter